MIERGKARGYINKNNELKVLLSDEGVWVKVIAMNEDKLEGIGILMNNPLDKGSIEWGSLVLFRELNPKQIPQIIEKVHEIPNKPKWKLKF